MNILFLSLSQCHDINARGIYTDLFRYFVKQGHCIYWVNPVERREHKETSSFKQGNFHVLSVKTLNIQKTNVVEKGIGTLLIDKQFRRAIETYWGDVHFNLVMYATPPITFSRVVKYVKGKHNVPSYLLLKDIFPQNAIDLGMIKKGGLIHRYFRQKEKKLYQISDYIGCMSPANVKFLLKHNPKIQADKVEVCPNSIELDPNASDPINRIDIRIKYHIPTNVPVFVYGGNLGKPQGVDFLIEVLNSNKDRQDVFFLVIGSGTEYKKIEVWFIKCNPKNALLMSALPKADYDRLIRACSVGMIFLDKRFTIPNFPSRLLSYLENRMPVLLATDRNSDMGHIAESNGFGFWTESGNIEAFNCKLDSLAKNFDIVKKMGEKGYQYLFDNYTVETSYNIIMSHFEK